MGLKRRIDLICAEKISSVQIVNFDFLNIPSEERVRGCFKVEKFAPTEKVSVSKEKKEGTEKFN